MNVFSWSLPFLAEKVSSMLYTIVKKCTSLDDDDAPKVDIDQIIKDENRNSTVDQDAKKKKLMSIKGKI